MTACYCQIINISLHGNVNVRWCNSVTQEECGVCEERRHLIQHVFWSIERLGLEKFNFSPQLVVEGSQRGKEENKRAIDQRSICTQEILLKHGGKKIIIETIYSQPSQVPVGISAGSTEASARLSTTR